MQTDEGLDTGPILLQDSLEIGPDETSLGLASRLSAMGARLIVDAVRRVDVLPRTRQDDAAATVARLLEKDDGRIEWTATTRRVYDRHRGVAGWPGSFFEHAGKRVKALEVKPAAGRGTPGIVLEVRDRVTVATVDAALELIAVQPEGKPRMSALDWARGYGIKQGVVLA